MTPGPWHAVNDTLVRGPHGEPVASTVGFAYPQDTNHAANAIAIAGLPGLLEAARAALRAMPIAWDRLAASYPEPGSRTDAACAALSAAIESLHAAVAACEGREGE